MASLTRRAIDNVGTRFRKYQERPADLQVIQEFRRLRCRGLASLFEDVARVIHDIPCVLSCRVKRVDTIVRKLRRENSMDLTRMDDIIGFRIVTPSPILQQSVAERLGRELRVRRMRNYTVEAKEGGYRGLHAIIEQNIQLSGSQQKYSCEIQVRTYYQNLWATVSESFGEQVKEGGGTEEEREYLQEFSEMIQKYEEGQPDAKQVEGLSTKVQISFIIKVFDKKAGSTVIDEYFGPDLDSAVARVLYLEDMYRSDFRREMVLLGLPTGDDEARITHVRYFEPHGRPEIPEGILPRMPRPNGR